MELFSTALVLDDAGLVLLVRPTERDTWVLPGTGSGPGETVAEAAVRAVGEATGVEVVVTGLVGISSADSPRVCLRARPVAGELVAGVGIADARWVEPERLNELTVDSAALSSMRHGLTKIEPYLD